MAYCQIHGRYSGDGCSDCRDAAEEAAADRQEMLGELERLREGQSEAQHELAYAINNPGDYACPHCRLRTLLRDASRCPRCHGEIDSGYWGTVREREEKERRIQEDQQRRAKEEWARNEKERHEAEQSAKQRERAGAFTVRYFGYWLPVLALGTHGLIGTMLNPHQSNLVQGAIEWLVISFIPLLNWIFTIGLLFSGGQHVILFLMFWGVIGGVFCFLKSP